MSTEKFRERTALSDRLRIALGERGMNATQLCEKTALSKGYISGLLAGKKNADRSTLVFLALVLQVNPAWLEHGHGSMSPSADTAAAAGTMAAMVERYLAHARVELGRIDPSKLPQVVDHLTSQTSLLVAGREHPDASPLPTENGPPAPGSRRGSRAPAPAAAEKPRGRKAAS